MVVMANTSCAAITMASNYDTPFVARRYNTLQRVNKISLMHSGLVIYRTLIKPVCSEHYPLPVFASNEIRLTERYAFSPQIHFKIVIA